MIRQLRALPPSQAEGPAVSASLGLLRSARVYTFLHPAADSGAILNRYSACWGGTSPTAEPALWAGRHRQDYKSQKASRLGGGQRLTCPPRFPPVPVAFQQQ